LVEEAAGHNGIVYIRANRGGTPVIYDNNETFPIGGSKVLRKSDKDKAALVGAGMTLHEALSAYEELKKEGIAVRVIDLYSVKPVDEKTLREAVQNTRFIFTVAGHYLEGDIGDAVKSVLTGLYGPPSIRWPSVTSRSPESPPSFWIMKAFPVRPSLERSKKGLSEPRAHGQRQRRRLKEEQNYGTGGRERRSRSLTNLTNWATIPLLKLSSM